jgi:hypothetical protein
MTTSTTPGERETGTGVIIFVSVHEFGALMTPPTETVLAPCALPKPLPVIVNGAPTGLTGPTVGDIRVITGEANAAGRKVQMNSKKWMEVRTSTILEFFIFRSLFAGGLKPVKYSQRAPGTERDDSLNAESLQKWSG